MYLFFIRVYKCMIPLTLFQKRLPGYSYLIKFRVLTWHYLVKDHIVHGPNDGPAGTKVIPVGDCQDREVRAGREGSVVEIAHVAGFASRVYSVMKVR